MNNMNSGRVRLSDSVISQKLNGEMVILNMDNQQYYSLDEVGVAMWECLVEQGNVDEAVVKLQAQYDVDGTVLRRDLEALMGKLVSAGLFADAD